MTNCNELVSIIIISYNSEKFIMDTLESTKNQTYSNIELIISDDCSKDNTISICENWMEHNKTRFNNVCIHSNMENLGLPGNCNKGLEFASGKYIKIIAADDILLPECIEKNMCFMKYNKCDFVFSKMIIFDENNVLDYDNTFVRISKNFQLNNKKRINKILQRNFIPAPTAFMNKKTLLELGRFDERYRMMEDLPLWFKALKNDCKIEFMDEYTVKYRLHSNSMTDQNSKVINESFYKSKKSFYTDYIRKELINRGKFLTLLDRETEFIFLNRVIKKGNNKKNITAYDKFLLYISPIRLGNVINLKIKKFIKKSYT